MHYKSDFLIAANTKQHSNRISVMKWIVIKYRKGNKCSFAAYLFEVKTGQAVVEMFITSEYFYRTSNQ